MNSKELEKYGFREWINFSDVSKSKIPESPGVYILRLYKQFRRLNGYSDILYIGSTANLRRRIYRNYIKSQGGLTTQRIHRYLFSKGYLDKVEISWIISEKYKETETLLLKNYEDEHHELPPWNRQG